MLNFRPFSGRSSWDTGEATVFWALAAIVVGVAAGILAGGVVTSVKWLGLVAAGALVVFSFARMEWMLLGLIVVTYINLSDTVTNYQNAPPVTKYYAVALLILIALRWLIKGDRLGGTKEGVGVLAFYAVATFVSVFVAENIDRVVEAWTIYAKDALIALAVMALLLHGATLRRVVWALVASGAFLSIATIYQYVTQAYPIAVGGFARAELHLIVQGLDSYRHAGPMDDANHFGQILVVIVPLAFERMLNESRRALRLVAASALGAVLAAILLTYSRGALLSLICMAGVFLLLYRRQVKLFVAVAAVALVAFQLAPAEYRDRVSTMTSLFPDSDKGGIVAEQNLDVAVEGRLGEMVAALQMFADNPLLGVGYGNYELHYQRYELQLGLPPRHQARSAHSLLLEIAAEQGIVGLAVFGAVIAMMVRSIMAACRTFASANMSEYRHIATAFGFALLGYGVAAMFLHNSYSRYLWMLAGIIFSLPKIATYEIEMRAKGEDCANQAHQSLDLIHRR